MTTTPAAPAAPAIPARIAALEAALVKAEGMLAPVLETLPPRLAKIEAQTHSFETEFVTHLPVSIEEAKTRLGTFITTLAGLETKLDGFLAKFL